MIKKKFLYNEKGEIIGETYIDLIDGELIQCVYPVKNDQTNQN